MNIYDYIAEGEEIEQACYVAAQALVDKGFQVIPLAYGDKKPLNIRSVTQLRHKPLNKHNLQYYFDRDEVGLGIMLVDKMEVIDIDDKIQKGIADKVLWTLQMAIPELYEKLVISRSGTNGAHIYYTADQIGGAPSLADCFVNGEKRSKIERLDESNKNYVMTAPSRGYKFIQKSIFEMPHLTAEERGMIISICRSFNEVIISPAPKMDQKREDAPWKVFNDQHSYTYIVEQLTDRGWEMVREYDDRIVVKRPGTSQAQSGSIWKDTATKYNLQNCLYLFTPNSEFEQARPYSPFDVYKTLYHDGNFMQAQAALAEKGFGVNIENEGQFWKREGKKIVVKYTELVHYFHELGYRKYLEQIVQVIDQVVTIRETGDMVRQFLHDLEPAVKDHFFERVGTVFSDTGGFMAMINELDDNFIRDTADATWLFFKNRAVKVSVDGIEECLYKDLNGYIWQDNIIDRDYRFTDFTDCDAHKFVGILGGDNAGKLEALLGYVMSRHKDDLITKAVILMEDIDPEEEGESMGRSGKGLIFKMIEKFRKTCRMNGKSFNFHDSFLWQNVELDTDIIFIDDVEKSFHFTKLYSVITESILVNKKGRDQIVIPYEKSPKIFITSNYAVGNSDESTTDRKFEFPVIKHFNAHHKPIDEFGRAFFSGWDPPEWSRFDNFMVHCAKAWLTSDKRNLSHITANSALRILNNQTHPDFIAYMDDQLQMNFFDFAPAVVKNARVTTADGKLVTNAVNMAQFYLNQENPDYYFIMKKEELLEKLKNIPKLTTTKLTQWFKLWAEHNKVEVNFSHKKSYEGGRLYRLISWRHCGNGWNNSIVEAGEGGKDGNVPF
jgi:hypothetical protein